MVTYISIGTDITYLYVGRLGHEIFLSLSQKIEWPNIMNDIIETCGFYNRIKDLPKRRNFRSEIII